MNLPQINEKSVITGVELRLDLALSGVMYSYPPSAKQVVLRGVSYDQAGLAAKLEDTAAPWKRVRDAHAIIRQFAQDKPELTKAAIQLLGDLKSSFAGQLGRDSQELEKFGFTPLKRPRPLTIEEKILRVAKAKLTRAKRGTKGNAQLAAIKETGTPSVTIAPDAPMQILPASVGTVEPVTRT